MKRRKQHRHLKDEANDLCDAWGEEIVILLDLSAGNSQQFLAVLKAS